MPNNPITPLKFWCQKVLPLVYDDSLSYMELLCKVVDKLNSMVEVVNSIGMIAKEEAKKALEEMIADGTIGDLINKELLGEINAKIAQNTADIQANTTSIQNNATAIQNNTNKINDLKTITDNQGVLINNNTESIERQGIKISALNLDVDGQIIPEGEFKLTRTNLLTQGFCASPTTFYTFYEYQDTNNYCYTVNRNTGAVSEFAMPEPGHYNDATYKTDTNTVLVISDFHNILFLDGTNLTLKGKFTMAPFVYGIAYNENLNKLVLVSIDTIYLCTIADYTISVDTQFPFNHSYTLQTCATYENLIFITDYVSPNIYPVSQSYNAVSFIYVYDFSGNKLSTITLPGDFGEIEGADISNDVWYFAYQRTTESNQSYNIQTVYKAPFFRNSESSSISPETFLNPSVHSRTVVVYANSEYSGFFCDGTSSKPFIRIQNAMRLLDVSNARLGTLNATGNFGSLSISSIIPNLTITGTNCTINYLSALGAPYVNLSGLIFNSIASGTECVYVNSCNVVVTGCTFNGNSKPYGLRAYTSRILITGANTFDKITNAINMTASELIVTTAPAITNITGKDLLVNNSTVTSLYYLSIQRTGSCFVTFGAMICEKGSATIASVPANSSSTASFNFRTEYSSAPNVLATISSDSNVNLVVTNITTTGCVFKAYNNTAEAISNVAIKLTVNGN